jgi:hypothetical protein
MCIAKITCSTVGEGKCATPTPDVTAAVSVNAMLLHNRQLLLTCAQVEQAVRQYTNYQFSVLRIAWVSLLLLTYLASSVKIDSYHSLVHDASVIVQHQVENENDPCHRSIYHHDSYKGCRHEAHFSKYDKCPLSDIAAVQAHVQVSACYAVTLADSFVTFPTLVVTPVTSDARLLSARAPPAC